MKNKKSYTIILIFNLVWMILFNLFWYYVEPSKVNQTFESSIIGLVGFYIGCFLTIAYIKD